MVVTPCQKNRLLYRVRFAACLSFLIIIPACSYRYYLGMHGPSVKKYPFMHARVTEDKSCLTCHSPGSTVASPKTSHPHFRNCLKCHNDDIAPKLLDRSKKPLWEW